MAFVPGPSLPACLPPGSSCTPPSVTTTVIDCPVIGEPYSFQIQVAGNGPMVFTVTAGSWPGGITMSSSGLLTGTPTDFGTGNVTVEVTGQCGTDTATIENCQPPAMFRWTLMSELEASGFYVATVPYNAFYGYDGEPNRANIPEYADHPVSSEMRSMIHRPGGYPITTTGDGLLVDGTLLAGGAAIQTVPISRTTSLPPITSDPNGGVNCGVAREIYFEYRTNVRSSIRVENLDTVARWLNAGSTANAAITMADLSFSGSATCGVLNQVTAFDGVVDFGGPTGNAGSGFSVPGVNGFAVQSSIIAKLTAPDLSWRKLTGYYGNVSILHDLTGDAFCTAWQDPLLGGPYTAFPAGLAALTEPPEVSVPAIVFTQTLTSAGMELKLRGRRVISEGMLYVGFQARIGSPRPIDGFTMVADGAIIPMVGELGYGNVNGYGYVMGGPVDGLLPEGVFASKYPFFAGAGQAFQINPEGLNGDIAIPTNGKVYHGLIADVSFLDVDQWKLVLLKALVRNPEGESVPAGNRGNIYSIPNVPITVSSLTDFTKPGGYAVTMTTSATRLYGNSAPTLFSSTVTLIPSTTTHNVGAFVEGGAALVAGYYDHVYGRLEQVNVTLQSQFVGSVQYENLDAVTTVADHGMSGSAAFTIGSYTNFLAVGGSITSNLTAFDGLNNLSGTSGFGLTPVTYGTASSTVTFDRLTAPTDVWDELNVNPSGLNLSITRVGDTPSFTFSQSPVTTGRGPLLGVRQVRITGTNFEYRYENSQGYLVVAWYVRLGIPSSITKLSDSSVIPMAPLGSWGSIDLGPFGVEIIRDLYERGGEEMYVARSANQVFASDGNLDFQINH